MEKYYADIRVSDETNQKISTMEIEKPATYAASLPPALHRFYGYVLFGKESGTSGTKPTFFSTEGLDFMDAAKLADKLNSTHRNSGEYDLNDNGDTASLYACYKVYVRVDQEFIKNVKDREIVVTAVDKLRMSGLSDADIELFMTTVYNNARAFDYIKEQDEKTKKEMVEESSPVAEAIDTSNDEVQIENQTWQERAEVVLMLRAHPDEGMRTTVFCNKFFESMRIHSLRHQDFSNKGDDEYYKEMMKRPITDFIAHNHVWSRFVTELTHKFSKYEQRMKVLYPLLNNAKEGEAPTLAEVFVRTWDATYGRGK